MKMVRRLLSIVCCLVFLIASVSALAETPTAVALSPKSITLNVGQTAKLTYTFAPVGSTTDDWTWSVTNPNVASVSKEGVVSALAAGTATVTFIILTNGQSDNCEVTVVDPLNPTPTPTPTPSPTPSPTPTPDPYGNIEVEVPSGTLHKNGAYLLNYGKTLKLSVTASGSWSGASVAWTTSGDKRAVVDATGLVTAKVGHAGNVNIRMTASNTSTGETVTKVIKLHVAPMVDMIKLSDVVLPLYLGQLTGSLQSTVRLSARVSPSIANYTTLYFTSKHPGVATVVDNGRVTAVSPGETNIVVTTDNGGRAVCTVKVGRLPSYVSLPQNISMKLGQKLPLYQKVKMDGSVKRLLWKSSAPGIVQVSQKGVIRAIRPGVCKVGVKTVNGKISITQIRVTLK